jgi:Peptidase family M23
VLACRFTCKTTAEAGVPVLSLHFVSTASPVNRRSFSKFTASAGWSGLRCLIAALLLVLPAAGQKSSPDQFTPVIVSPLTGSTRPFPGTDGKYHVVYELVVTNTKPTPATLKKVEVLDARSQGVQSTAVVASYEGDALVSRLRTLANTPVNSPEIEFGGTRLFLIDLTFDARAQVPGRLRHLFELTGASGPAPTAMTPAALSYTVAPLEVHPQLPDIGPPLAGKRWVAFNGCCEAGGVHRGSSLAANGSIYYAQRFAIDWMRLDDAGRLVHGNPADVHNYTCYGADLLAVADGTVVQVLDALGDQPPGELPDPKTMTVENALGNHVILDLGAGVYAFYAHMEKGSIRVAVGQRVKRGDVLGKLGNSGNTSAPHLHFHLMEGPSALASNGIPYLIDSFALAGKIPAEKDPAAANGIEGSWSGGLFPSPSPRHGQFPLDLDVINFPEAPGKQ